MPTNHHPATINKLKKTTVKTFLIDYCYQSFKGFEKFSLSFLFGNLDLKIIENILKRKNQARVQISQLTKCLKNDFSTKSVAMNEIFWSVSNEK